MICDLLGVFGRGYMAKAERKTEDQTVDLHYDNIERANTPAIMAIKLGPAAIRHGEVHLFVSTSVVKDLGAARIAPQPATSTIDQGGIIYTFPVSGTPATVDIALSPSYPGIYTFTLGVVGAEKVKAKVVILP